MYSLIKFGEAAGTGAGAAVVSEGLTPSLTRLFTDPQLPAVMISVTQRNPASTSTVIFNFDLRAV